MSKYLRLLDAVKQRLDYKCDKYPHITAIKIKTEQDFDLAISFWSEAYSYCGQYPKTQIKGEFRGEDWYFVESKTFDYGMGASETNYWLETLTDKKRKFAEFCKDFE